MILLKEFLFSAKMAVLQNLEGDLQTHKIPLTPVFDAASALGLQHLLLQRPDGTYEKFALSLPMGRTAPLDAQPSSAAPLPTVDAIGLEEVLLEHLATVEEGRLVYDARFSHEKAALPFMTAWMSILLAAAGFRETHILQSRLALYELSANAVEHGVVLQTPPEIGIHLALTPGELSGWIQDGCEHFDPTAQPAGSIRQRAESRATRGYGIHMMHQLLEQFRHEFNTTGNRIHFRKRFGR
jgi:anti-sigma regulatory factor (Ser/Thr protein kinase)